MKVVMVMFDSLNRHMLSPYGCEWVHTPNFQRLAERAVTFDTAYVGSLPCMPARRELHTGRYNFLHRSWGPIEPFDDSTPEILKTNGVRTHLISDHYHYWEEGGSTYHTRYSSWEISRGQEGDPWKTNLTDDPGRPVSRNDNLGRPRYTEQDWTNRRYARREEDTPIAKTFQMGLDFLDTNAEADNWFLQIETFDPHEPFYVPQKYLDMYPHAYDGDHWDWPPYAPVSEEPAAVEHLRYVNAALHTMCDAYLGKVLDKMDELDLWDDTMLIVNCDHGFLLSEHGYWGKNYMPVYNQIAHMPMFAWDPRSKAVGERRESLVQNIDIPATLLEYFGIDRPADMQGRPLREVIATDTGGRDAGLFGYAGRHANVTDGRYVYMRAPATPENPSFEYTLMPCNMAHTFSVDKMQQAELAGPFSFTKGCRTMRIPRPSGPEPYEFGSMLFDVQADPDQQNPLNDPDIEQRMIALLRRLMIDTDAPREEYTRLGLEPPH